MLKIIKEQISASSSMDFNDYFRRFVISVQDKNIESELRFLSKYNQLNVNSMQFLINNTYERLKSIYDNSNIITE